MAQVNRLDVTINKALKNGWLAGGAVFMVIPVSRDRVINSAADVATIMTAYSDYFDGWADLPAKVTEWLDSGNITIAADGLILWE
jgi:hypothetical protein